MKIKAKIVSAIMALTVTCAVAGSMNASAIIVDHGRFSKSSVNDQKRDVQTQYSAVLTWPNGINKVNWEGQAGTYWWGDTPYNADHIQHTNSVELFGIGSFSVGTDTGVSVDDGWGSETIDIDNDYSATIYFDYHFKRSIYTISTNFRATGQVQLGHCWYGASCGTDD